MTFQSHTKARAGVIIAVDLIKRPKRYPVARLTIDTARDIRKFNVPVLGRYTPQVGQWIYTRGISVDIMFVDPKHYEPTTIPFTRASAITYIKKEQV